MKEKTSQRKTEEKRREIEEEVVQVLTDKRLSAIKSMLEKDHAIDCIFLLMLKRGRWKQAKEFKRKLALTLPDGTFRARMLEIEDNGLAGHENIDAIKKRWLITEFGNTVGKLLLEFFSQIPNRGAL